MNNDVEVDIKTKKPSRGSSIFVEAFQQTQVFPAVFPGLNYYDTIVNQLVKKSVMLKAHLTCAKQINNLPRKIDEKDKTVTFDKKYSALFRKNKN